MKCALTVAGSDPSGGAGIQADLKTFHQHGVYGMAVPALLTVQNTTGVKRVVILDSELVRDQLRAVLDDIPPDAIKTGALGSAAVIAAVASELRESSVPLIVDPVMLSKNGSVLLEPDAVETLVKELFPLAYLVTPNIPEALALARFEGLQDEAGESEESVLRLGRAILNLGAKRVLIKGGHRTGHPTDILFDGNQIFRFAGLRLSETNTHGTGCALTATITALLATGSTLQESIEAAKKFVACGIKNAPGLGRGLGPLNLLQS